MANIDEETNCTFSKRGKQHFLTWIMHDPTLPNCFRIRYSPCYETKDGVTWQLSLWSGICLSEKNYLFCTLTRKEGKGPSKVHYSVDCNIFIGHQRPEHALCKRQTPVDKAFKKGTSMHFWLLPVSYIRKFLKAFPLNAPPKLVLQICLQKKSSKNIIAKSLSVVSELDIFTGIIHRKGENVLYESGKKKSISEESKSPEKKIPISTTLCCLSFCRLYLLDVNGHIRTSSEPRMFESGKQIIHNFIRKDLLTPEFSRDGEISLLFELSVECGLEHISYKQDTRTFFDRTSMEIDSLSNNMKHLFQNRRAVTNIEIITGVDVLKVHKGVISARSCVFHSMLSHNMTEKLSKVINIEDIDIKTLENFFGYLYSGAFGNGMEWMDVCYLYAAANKYCVQSLRHACLRLLTSCISLENRKALLDLSDLFGDEDLKSSLNVFKLLHSRKVIYSNGCHHGINFREIRNYLKRLREE